MKRVIIRLLEIRQIVGTSMLNIIVVQIQKHGRIR